MLDNFYQYTKDVTVRWRLSKVRVYPMNECPHILPTNEIRSTLLSFLPTRAIFSLEALPKIIEMAMKQAFDVWETLR